jgi:hypothetical protein
MFYTFQEIFLFIHPMGRISFLEFGQVFGELETKIKIKNYSPCWCFHFFFGWVLPKAVQDRKGVIW